MLKSIQIKSIAAWLAWSISGFFYFYEICLRIQPSISSEYYRHFFSIDATQFGLLTVLYYASYTLMQIPAGMIVDRLPLYKVLFIASLCCVFGFFCVSHTLNFTVALFGRFAIGLGSAFAYVAALKAATLWLPPKRFGFVSCMLDSLGMLGAVFVNLVLVRINLNMGISTGFHFLLLTGVMISLCIYFGLPRQKASLQKNVTPTNFITLASQARLVLNNKTLWGIGLISALYYLPSSVVGDTWGVPYLESVYHYTKSSSTLIMTAFFVAWAVFGPIIGYYSDRFNNRMAPICVSLLIITLSFALLIYLPQTHFTMLPHWAVVFLFVVIGAATGAHPLVFAVAKEQFAIKRAGTVVAATNMLTMMGGLVFQPIVGYLLDLHHHTVRAHGLVHYSSADYSFGFSLLPCLLLLACLSTFLLHRRVSPILPTRKMNNH